MNIGQPWEFAITFELLEETNNKDQQFGYFNFVIEDQFIPGFGSNYTLNMVFNHLRGNLEEINNIKPFDFLKEDNNSLFFNVFCRFGVETEYEHKKISNEILGIDITPLEVDATKGQVYYFRSNKEECLVYSLDFGKTVMKKVLPLGTVKNVIEQLPKQPL